MANANGVEADTQFFLQYVAVHCRPSNKRVAWYRVVRSKAGIRSIAKSVDRGFWRIWNGLSSLNYQRSPRLLRRFIYVRSINIHHPWVFDQLPNGERVCPHTWSCFDDSAAVCRIRGELRHLDKADSSLRRI